MSPDAQFAGMTEPSVKLPCCHASPEARNDDPSTNPDESFSKSVTKPSDFSETGVETEPFSSWNTPMLEKSVERPLKIGFHTRAFDSESIRVCDMWRAGSEEIAMVAAVIDSVCGKSMDPSSRFEYVLESLMTISTSLDPALKSVTFAPLANGVKIINRTRKSAIFVCRFLSAMVSPNPCVSTLY